MYRNIYPLSLLPTHYSGFNFLNIHIKNLVMGSSLFSGKNIQPSISSTELFKISDEISRKFSPVPADKLDSKTNTPRPSTSELLEVSQKINLYYAPKAVSADKCLTLLSVDPRHIYVYWNLNNDNPNALLHTMNSNELVLRVYSQPELNNSPIKPIPLLELPVHDFQHQQKIPVPIASQATLYSASIGKPTAENKFLPVIKSNELHVSRGGGSFISPHSKDDNDLMSHYDFMTAISSYQPEPSKHYASTNLSGRGK